LSFFNPFTYNWYVIPLLAIVIYIYIVEVRKARESEDWNIVYAGLTVLGMDFINETWNGWVYVFTGRAFWTTVGPTAMTLMVGWNIEILFFFSILGIIYGNAVSKDQDDRVLGIPNWWFWAVSFAVICVVVECFLNLGGYLVWFYPFWNLSLTGIWLIFLIGYFHFFVAALIVMKLEQRKYKTLAVILIWSIAIIMNVVAQGLLHWHY